MKVTFRVVGRKEPDRVDTEVIKDRIDTEVILDGHGEDILDILIAIKQADFKII